MNLLWLWFILTIRLYYIHWVYYPSYNCRAPNYMFNVCIYNVYLDEWYLLHWDVTGIWVPNWQYLEICQRYFIYQYLKIQYLCIYIYTFNLFLHIWTHWRTHTHTRTHIYCIYIHIYIHTYIYIYRCMSICMGIWSRSLPLPGSHAFIRTGGLAQ